MFPRILPVLLSAALLSGCAGLHLNEGASRTRLASPSDPALKGAFLPHGQGGVVPIRQGQDFVSVKLISAFICDFHETATGDILSGQALDGSNSRGAICKGGDGKDEARKRITRGEILIVANAGEPSADHRLGFDPAQLRSRGRVVYYNPDVRESGQLINAVNLPIYGPKRYQGFPFFLDIAVMELDNEENEEIKALLGTLASLGSSGLTAITPQIQKVLGVLGEAMVAANSDDLELRYQLGFDVPAGASGSRVHRLQLAEGYYALVREENRSAAPDWDKLCIDPAEGLILHKPKSGECALSRSGDGDNVWREQTWLLVRVSREDPNSPEVEQALALEAVDEFLQRNSRWDPAKLEEAAAKAKEALEAARGKPSPAGAASQPSR